MVWSFVVVYNWAILYLYHIKNIQIKINFVFNGVFVNDSCFINSHKIDLPDWSVHCWKFSFQLNTKLNRPYFTNRRFPKDFTIYLTKFFRVFFFVLSKTVKWLKSETVVPAHGSSRFVCFCPGRSSHGNSMLGTDNYTSNGFSMLEKLSYKTWNRLIITFRKPLSSHNNVHWTIWKKLIFFFYRATTILPWNNVGSP